MLAASIVVEEGETVLHDVPDIQDVERALELLRAVGARVHHDKLTKTVRIDAADVKQRRIAGRDRRTLPRLRSVFWRRYRFVLAMLNCRAAAAAISARARSTFTIADSPVLALTSNISRTAAPSSNLKAGALGGAMLYLDLPSHTGTENLMLAASLAEGRTILENASVEPEVVDFGNFLNKMGADIQGSAPIPCSSTGVRKLNAVEYTPMPDRLVAGTMMMACAIAGGDVTIGNVDPSHLRIVSAKLEQMGVDIKRGQHTRFAYGAPAISA